MTMQMDRREMVKAAAAAILAAPLAASASGDSPKQAYFGAAPISAPFGDTYGTTGAGVWEKLNPTEKGIFERILKSTVTSLEDVDKLVSNQSWQLAGDRLRNSMYETRKAMLRITEANGSEYNKDLFVKFKQQIERADLAIKKKEGMNALKYSTGAQATFAKWRTSVDI